MCKKYYAQLTGSFRLVVAVKATQVDGQNGARKLNVNGKGEADRQGGVQGTNHSLDGPI